MIGSLLETASEEKILTVSALTGLIARQLESRFPFVWVRGEVADYSLAQSGHMYFSLKDSHCILQCVWFSGKRKLSAAGRKFDPLTGEVFEHPEPDPATLIRNGLEIVCAGAICVYRPAGRHQLIVEFARPVGDGAQLLALEERKRRLALAGYFAQSRKRRIPLNPARVALVTSPAGAAIHDFLKMAQTRGLPSTIRLFPVMVQGAGAAEKIAETINRINTISWADVIVLIRGGGSGEDLGEFNEEVLADAIFNSRLPVVAGIGHEVDTFIADMTADLRAATPTHAAQLLWPLRHEIFQTLDALQLSLERAMRANLRLAEERLAHIERALGFLSPLQRLARDKERIDMLNLRLAREIRNLVERNLIRLRQNSKMLTSHAAVYLPSRLERLQFFVQNLSLRIRELLERSQTCLEMAEARLPVLYSAFVQGKSARLQVLDEVLRQRNPMAPLKRGYAFLYDGNRIISSVRQCSVDRQIRARLRDGELILRIEAAVPQTDSASDSQQSGV